MDLQQWLSDVNGRVIGAGECWDLAEDYDKRVVNGPILATSPSVHAGYAIGVWDGYGQNGVEAAYSQAGPESVMLPGWLPVWKWGQVAEPFSHIAVGVQDEGGSVQVMSQNPGPAHYMSLSKQGLAGYLVPRNGGTSSTIALASVNTSSNPVSQISGVVNFFADVSRFINTPGIWNRIGIYIAGGFVLTLAVVYLFKDETVSAIKGVLD